MHKSIFSLVFALLFLLTSCSQHFANMNLASEKCGYRKDSFDVFADCIKKINEVTEPEQGMVRGYKKYNGEDGSDGVSVMKNRFNIELEALTQEYKNDLFNEPDSYFDQYDKMVLFYKQEEQVANRNAQAVAAIVLVGAAVVAACQNGGCEGGGGGGGYSSNLKCNLQGCCSYHNGVSGVGYNGRVVCNDGNYSPTCTCP